MSGPASANRQPGVRSILLGLFVLFQLIYLPLSNLIQFVPRAMPAQQGEFDIRKQREGTVADNRAVQEAINSVGRFVDRYGEFSGQVQYWSLFAPFGTQTIVPFAEFEFGDGRERFLMRHQPQVLQANPSAYLRWPGPYSRLYSYEYLLGVVYDDYSDQFLQARPAEWRKVIREHARRLQKSLDAYFRFSLAVLRQAHPELPEPRAGILNVWIHPSPRPGERERPPAFTMPLARWVPGREPDDRKPAIEAYDPIEMKFVALDRD